MSEAAAAHLSHNHIHAEPPKMGRFERIAGRFGVPVAILAFVGVAVWCVASWASREWEWAKTNVVLPVAQKHMEFVDRVDGDGKQRDKILTVIAEGQDRIAKGIDELKDAVTSNGDETHKLISEQTERMNPKAPRVASAKPEKPDRPEAPPMPETEKTP